MSNWDLYQHFVGEQYITTRKMLIGYSEGTLDGRVVEIWMIWMNIHKLDSRFCSKVESFFFCHKLNCSFKNHVTVYRKHMMIIFHGWEFLANRCPSPKLFKPSTSLQNLNAFVFCLCFSFENNRLSGPELQGLVPYDLGCWRKLELVDHTLKTVVLYEKGAGLYLIILCIWQKHTVDVCIWR